MSLPTLVKTYTFSNNNRISFVSLNDTMARYLFGIKNFLVATMGWTVKYTCDGTTGPTSGADHTDRWATFSNAATRGANGTTAQSFAVITDGNGCDLLLAYEGGSDDIALVAWSNGGLYTPAGTSNQKPTATDEGIMMSAISIIGATASLDRVWHIQASTDNKIFRTHIFRSSTFLYGFGMELVTREPNMLASFVWSPVVSAWGSNNTQFQQNGSPFGSSAANNRAQARISGTNVEMGSGGESLWNISVAQPELQAFSPIVPTGYYNNTTANLFGRVADRIDIWGSPASNSFGQGDTFGSLGFAFLGAYILPWDGVTTPSIA